MPLLPEEISQIDFPTLFKQLLSWYDQEKRSLPWRINATPYRIWLSEIMLQQTRVETVIPYYERFIACFPTLKALAEGDEQQVLFLWQGLGYYSRARNLHRGAKWIQETGNGVFPSDRELLLKVPGVGPYTAGAILSMAFKQPAPAIDGNLCRVFSRLWRLEDDMTQGKVRADLSNALAAYWDKNRPGDINQALMDLSAKICTINNPLCSACPLTSFCQSRQFNETESYPIRKKKKASPVVYLAIAVISNSTGDYLLSQRKSTGLLAGLWEFANEAGETPEQAHQLLQNKLLKLKLSWEKETLKGCIKHIFTHRIWEMQVFYLTASVDLPVAVSGYSWLPLLSLDENFLLAGPHRKIAEWLRGELH